MHLELLLGDEYRINSGRISHKSSGIIIIESFSIFNRATTLILYDAAVVCLNFEVNSLSRRIHDKPPPDSCPER